ncbi:hypothetical protein QLX08_008677 [Tetragonisca angustula]|uniref:Uncharacterized protein n=1 Tax=Tetragonisca angustula TaxID=166442 RepID=A0AAW0ZJI7_9HYME
MNKNVEHSQHDVRENEKLSSIFPLQESARCQPNRENKVSRTTSEEQNYLNERNIFDIFHFLLSHVIVHQPSNPIQYLHKLLDDLILFRAGLKEPRLLWAERHLNAMFENILFHDSEFLQLDGYRAAMKMMGIRSYDPCPAQLVEGYVDRETFCTEALNCMKKELLHITNESAKRTPA